MECIFKSVLGILIILFILGICFLMMYWGLNQIYKYAIKSKQYNDAELAKELYSLKERVELLERKLEKK